MFVFQEKEHFILALNDHLNVCLMLYNSSVKYRKCSENTSFEIVKREMLYSVHVVSCNLVIVGSRYHVMLGASPAHALVI